MNNKEIALSYLRQGLPVIPLWSPELIKQQPAKFANELKKKLEKNREDENPKSKEEVTKELLIDFCKRPKGILWAEYQNRLPSEDEVIKWFSDWPDANIGIVTGKISNLVVFDLDSTAAVEYAESEGGFPDTPKVKTGKGYHIYMRHPGFEIRNSVNKKLDIDIRADGGYAVAPPSIHGSGCQYQWESGFSIHDIKPAACEPWMIEYLQNISSPDKQKTTDRTCR